MNNPQWIGGQPGNYQPCTHTPLELAKKRAEELRYNLQQTEGWRKELAQLERMIAAAEESTVR